MLNLKNYFANGKYGLAVDVSGYVTHATKPMPDLHFTDPYTEELYSEMSKTPDRGQPVFGAPKRFNEQPWATMTRDCNGEMIKFHLGKSNLPSRNAQLVVADICTQMREKGAESVYLYWPYAYNMTWDDRDMFERVTTAVKDCLIRLLKRNVRTINFTTGMLAGTEFPGYLILTSDEQYEQFLQDIGAIMSAGTNHPTKELGQELLYTALNPSMPYDSGTPTVSTKDIDLELEIALGIDETPFTPEKFANRLLIDYGYIFDANSIIRGTRLAKIHRVWPVLPMMAGGVADHYALMDKVVKFCIANANITSPEDKRKKSSGKKGGYFAAIQEGLFRKVKGPTFHRPTKDTTPPADVEDSGKRES